MSRFQEGNFAQGYHQDFKCTADKAGFNIEGNITGYMHDIFYFDFHKYLSEAYPFESDTIGWLDSKIDAAKVTDDEEVFKNPWVSLSQATLEMDRSDYPEGMNNSDALWSGNDNPFDFAMLLCTTTVWDITYTAIGQEVTSLSKTKSNGSVAGIASMPGIGSWGLIPNTYDRALQYASASASSIDAFIDSYAAGLSNVRSYSLATQMSPRPALLTQTRVSKVITKVPVAALWLLVVANALYALLGVGLAALALTYTSPSVHQVYTRLSITGIVAQLFEEEYAERAVESEEKLFRENVEIDAEIKRVGVKRTDTGGSAFAVSEKRLP
ncbi:hypothetical protein N0V90_007187 [Kalmusia sp. IMI 367209]|nr:hypothetical protein N0V90_007187 [Kalmusia sp. IMI 367209]